LKERDTYCDPIECNDFPYRQSIGLEKEIQELSPYIHTIRIFLLFVVLIISDNDSYDQSEKNSEKF
jgi:hypothetical protein